MPVLPFKKTDPDLTPGTRGKIERPNLEKTVLQIRAALANGDNSLALNLVAPWLTDDDTPPIALLLAGRALTALRRYPEALGYLEQYTHIEPSCSEGLLAAGIAAAGAREIARAVDWFNKATHSLSGVARQILEPYILTGTPDPIAIENLVVEVESHPDDCDRVLALSCALGQAGHFKAIERFLSIIDSSLLPLEEY